MNWEETIEYIRKTEGWETLVKAAYLESDLPSNVENFRRSEEFQETLRTIRRYAPGARSVLDVGSGNGVSAVAFALEGFRVTSIEPDPSDTVGAGAIRYLKNHYSLNDLNVIESFAENCELGNELFDVVYTRQCMHHAHDLNKFIENLTGFLRSDGLFLTVRDHVVYNESDKAWFLECHLLQRFYGGENAFTLHEYRTAFENAGLTVTSVLKHFDSVINYYPLSIEEKKRQEKEYHENVRVMIKKYYGVWGNLNFMTGYFGRKVNHLVKNPHKEEEIPGRMYSFVAKKNSNG